MLVKDLNKDVINSLVCFGLFYGVSMPLSTIFSYIMAVSLIGGRNWRNPEKTQRKQPTCRKSLTNFIT
jgi:hypothetical protein